MRITERYENLLMAFGRFMNKLKEAEKIPIDFGSGERLYSSEIHTIVYIGSHPDINVTNLAKIMGVTKGAISQAIKKLEKKKLVERHRSPTNNKEILLHLTKKGEIDYHGHEAFHAKHDAEFFQALANISSEQIQFLEYLFEQLEAALDRQLQVLK